MCHTTCNATLTRCGAACMRTCALFNRPEQGWNAALTTYLRFGEWDALLSDKDAVLPPTAPPFPFAVVIQHYARGLAMLHVAKPVNSTGIAKAKAELAELQQVAGKVSPAGGIYNYTRLVSVANLTLSAAIARATVAAATAGAVPPMEAAVPLGNSMADALVLLQRAADEQNSWHYDEPPDWHAPVR